MRTTTRAAALAAGVTLVGVLALAGCAQTVTLQPADDAANPLCAKVSVELTFLDTVAGLEPRETNAQATAAWGEPATVLLRCGVASPPPTAEFPCFTIEGVDWLRDDTGDPNFVFTTYGRTPAVEVIIDSDGDPDIPDDGVSGLEALTDVARAVAAIPADRECVAIGEAG